MHPTDDTDTTTELAAEPLTDEGFAPYGSVIAATDDGEPFGESDAVLELSQGTPRFYVMRLEDKPPQFARITRHRRVTQCLASVGGEPWMLGVAPPSDDESDDAVPDLDRLSAFVVPGDVAVALHRGTWHAGPFFTAPSVSFFNLELTDTNEVDHHTVHLDETFGRRFTIEPHR